MRFCGRDAFDIGQFVIHRGQPDACVLVAPPVVELVADLVLVAKAVLCGLRSFFDLCGRSLLRESGGRKDKRARTAAASQPAACLFLVVGNTDTGRFTGAKLRRGIRKPYI